MRPALALAALLLLAGCGGGRTYALTGVGSYHRHEAHPSIGVRHVRPGGTEIEARWRPSLQAWWPGEEHVSDRAEPEEWSPFEVEIAWPVGGGR